MVQILPQREHGYGKKPVSVCMNESVRVCMYVLLLTDDLISLCRWKQECDCVGVYGREPQRECMQVHKPKP